MRALLRSLSAVVFAGVLLTAVPAALAEDPDVEHEAAEELEGEHGGDHHGSHAGSVFRNPFNPENEDAGRFWTGVLNFTLLVIVLLRFGRGPTRDFLGKRRAEMERAINEAAQAKAAAEAKLAEYNTRLGQLDNEMAKLKADLAASAEEDKKRIVAEAEETARRMKIETEALIDQHAKALSAQVRRELVDGAIATAEKLLREKITAADQQQLADAFRSQVGTAAKDSTLGGAP